MTEPRPRLLSDEDVHATSWETLGVRVGEMSTPHAPFYLLVALSTAIAAFGLLANSTAVVIGAMLIAPLMGPIFGIALGLAKGDTELLARAAGAEARGMALAILLGIIIGLTPHGEFGTEILARTRPTVYDIAVALGSGLAGAFALTDERVSPALPGVAIATAIVPPLATVGLCLADGEFVRAGGAFLLFAANLVAIEAAAVAWFTWTGIRRGHLHEHFRLLPFVRHFGVSLLLLVVLGAFMTRTLRTAMEEERLRRRLTRVLGDDVRITRGARLTELTTDRQRDSLEVLAVVLTPQEFTPEQVQRLEARVRAVADRPTRLIVRSILSRDADARGPVYVSSEELAQRGEAERQTAFLSRASSFLRARFAAMPGVELEELRREREDGDLVLAVVRTPTAFTPARVDSLDRDLDIALGTPVRLIVRSVLTRDADATRFLHDTTVAADSLPAPALTPAAPAGLPPIRAPRPR